MNPTKTQDLRVEKTIQVLNRFLDGSDWSRRELQEESGISYGTISILLNGLERAGVITLDRLEASQGGRRAGRYRIVPTFRLFAQIEIRSYGFNWSIRDMTGREIAGGIIPDDTTTDINSNLSGTVSTVLNALATLEIPADRLHSMGVALPGHYRAGDDAVVKPSTPRIGELAIESVMRRQFEGELLVESDVNAAAIFDLERVLGSRRSTDTDGTILYLVTTADGIGASLLINGHIHYGATGHAGEVHMFPVATDGGWQTLGDCLDPVVLAARVGIEGEDRPRFDQLRTMIWTGRAATERQYPRVVDAFAQAIYLLDSILDPDAIVIAGLYCGFGPRLSRDVTLRLVEIAEPDLMDDVEILQSDGSEGLAMSGLFRMQTRNWAEAARFGS
ncbi:MAG: ROK family transcriptional regulator [Spirochaetaceae bacterium]|nr:MAG: ROK family transcriptional regulator [Spirochaetaceae bacterium]